MNITEPNTPVKLCCNCTHFYRNSETGATLCMHPVPHSDLIYGERTVPIKVPPKLARETSACGETALHFSQRMPTVAEIVAQKLAPLQRLEDWLHSLGQSHARILRKLFK